MVTATKDSWFFELINAYISTDAMEDFDGDPLDLLDDDGDGVIEMCLFFDEDEKDKQGGGKAAW